MTMSCKAADKCGGCTWIHMPYEQQLAVKDQMMHELFSLFASESSIQLMPITGTDDPYHYRNKVTSPFAPGKRGPHGGREILHGMYEAGSHRIIDSSECLLENERAQHVIRSLVPLMKRYKIVPYDEDLHKGFLRYAIVRVGHESQEMLLTLVTNGEDFPASRNFCRDLVKKCPYITSIVQNINTSQTNTILGKRERRLYGPGFILDTLCGLSFKVSSQSFYQVNSLQTARLYETAIQLADLKGNEIVIDAYCGTGTIGLVAAKRGAAQVIGIDNVESAVHDARENARHNGIDNARFVCADAGDYMLQEAAHMTNRVVDVRNTRRKLSVLSEETLPGAHSEVHPQECLEKRSIVVFMDPPRTGSSPEFLQALINLAPDKIVYISCNPHTQARDLEYVCERGYALRIVQPIDMFPHTPHIESVALLQKE